MAKSSVKKPSKMKASAKKARPARSVAKPSGVSKSPKPAKRSEATKSARKATKTTPSVKSAAARSERSNVVKVKSKPENGTRSEPVIVPSPVPTNGKPRKNQAGLSSKELEHYRELLLAKRRELIGDMSSMEREALRSTSGTNLSNLPLHMADMGTDNYEQEFTLGLVEKDRQLLREINQALAKIQDGTYGLCEGTGKPIGKARLEAQPWAKYSIEHARMMERSGMGIRRL